MTKHVVVPAPGTFPAFNTSLGITQQLLDKGFEVDLYLCNGKKLFCPGNQFINTPVIGKSICALCKRSSKAKILALENTVKLTVKSLDGTQAYQGDMDKVPFDPEIQTFSYSNLQSRIGETKLDYTQRNARVFQLMLRQNFESLAFAKQIAADMNPLDKMVIFNGRLCGFYPFVRTAKDNGLSFYCFEMPDSGSGAFVSEGAVVHDPKVVSGQLHKFYVDKKPSDEEVLEYARRWISGRLNGTSSDNNAAYARKNVIINDDLESRLKRYNRVFSFFVSTEYENDFMSDVIYFGYRSQLSFLKDFVETVLKKEDALIIRCHPHMVNLDKSFRDALYDLIEGMARENIFLIKADERFSSFQCIQLSDAVLCFGSTTGIESALLKKPVFTFCNRVWGGFEFDQAVAELKGFDRLLERTLRVFDADAAELGAAKFIYSFHRYFNENALVHQSDSRHFRPTKPSLVFRAVNYIYLLLNKAKA